MRAGLLVLLAGCSGMQSSGMTGADGSSGGGGGGGDAAVHVTPDYVSGSRLKTRVLTSPDGAAQAVGFFDSQLGQVCAFAAAADGAIRCLPTQVLTVLPDYFADAACTVRLAGLLGGCVLGSPQYVTDTQPTSSCHDSPSGYSTPYQVQVFALGAAFTGTVYLKSGGCASTGAGGSFWSIGAEVTPSTFVAGSIVIQ